MLLRYKLLLTLFVTVVRGGNVSKVCLNKLGCLLGTEMSGYSDGENFEAFLGVPYAKPPIGDLRFRNPEPVEPWEGVLMAQQAKSDCKQKKYLQPQWPITGNEDCLYLNIYRPKSETKNPLPVLFYIHGGGFFSGSSNPGVIGPEYFMDKREVVVVVVNYRLGPFGFLSSGCRELPGNFGLKDQLLALKWVNGHIAEFGGDPNEITLFGHSAGASAVHFHMINPHTKGKFKRAILSSGTALAPFVGIIENPVQQLNSLAQALGIESPHTLTPNELADKLRTLDANAILNAGDVLKFWRNHDLFNFRPVIEDASDKNAFLIEHPHETMKKGNYELRPWLTGLVSYKGEGAAVVLQIYDNQTWRSEFNNNFDENMQKLLNIHSEEQLNRFINECMQGIHELSSNNGDGFLELFSDYHFYYPVYKTLKHYFNYADVEKYPAFIYKFSYHGPYSYAPFYAAGSSTNQYDVVHIDDLIYQFRQSAIFPDFEKSSIDHQLTNEFLDIILEFIKTGKPSQYDAIGSCTKEELLTSGSKAMCKYLEFVNTPDGYERVISNGYHIERMKLWEDILN